jgi:hypothetical protein
MMGNRKGFSTVFLAMATLLICCNPASSFVNQTSNSRLIFCFIKLTVSKTYIILHIFFSGAAANVVQGMVLFFPASDPCRSPVYKFTV